MNQTIALNAFLDADFRSVHDLAEVWEERGPAHVALNQDVLRAFEDSLARTKRMASGGNPIGLAILGAAGSGKTHMLGEIRREAARQDCNFVLADLTDVRDFWPLIALSYLRSLQCEMNGVRQSERLFAALFEDSGNELPLALARLRKLPVADVVESTGDLVQFVFQRYQNELRDKVSVLRTLRALLYLESGDLDLNDRAYSFLQGIGQIDEEAKALGLHGPTSAEAVARDLAWLLSKRSVTVLALDQLDPFVAQNGLVQAGPAATPREREALIVLNGVVNGLMSVRETHPRTLIVLSCIETSWKVLRDRAVGSFSQKVDPVRLKAVKGQEPPELIRARLAAAYQAADFAPPSPHWPFTEAYLEQIPDGHSPREVLNLCESYRRRCALARAIVDPVVSPDPPAVNPDAFRDLDECFARARAETETGALLVEESEDKLGDIVASAARWFLTELPHAPDVDLHADTDFRDTKQHRSLHTRARRIFRAELDREEHVCIRVLQKHHAGAFKARLTAMMTASGVSEHLEGRRAVALRTHPLPGTPKSKELIDLAIGQKLEFIGISDDDLRTLVAVVKLAESGNPSFEGWLLRNRPLSGTQLFRAVFQNWIDAASDSLPQHVSEEPKPLALAAAAAAVSSGGAVAIPALERPPERNAIETKPAVPAIVRPATPAAAITLGRRFEAGVLGQDVAIPIPDLSRHIVMRAGSGSGKTVFVKRLVEEAALCGVPSIVVDVAKDLSLLGDAWPSPPPDWNPEDAELAARYHESVDVQIWTPGRPDGRPVRLPLVPSLSGFYDSNEREAAIDAAVSGLLPVAVKKKNPDLERAVLHAVMRWLAQNPSPGTDSTGHLVAALRDLPPEAIQGYQNERKLAAQMADQIQAVKETDPLYRNPSAEELDPAVLFGVDEAKTRISVLSLFGMQAVDSQARFIGQLAVTLFNWIRKNPVRPPAQVRGLLVIDEAARFLPRGNAESKPGLLLLAQQARKYGLGLVLATQNPMDLDYNATANFATHLYGTANQPQVVDFIRKALQEKGVSGANPGQLKVGEFYCFTPSVPKPVRIKTSLCLSAHPNNTQLSDDEILGRACAGRR